ncbi:MAG: threonine/serine exporter family protein [Propionibacteriaceae bacterium]
MSLPPVDLDEHEMQTRALLAHLGNAMVATGETVHEVEQELALVSSHLGYPDVQIAAAPTGITVTLQSGGVASYQGARGTLRLDQAVDVRRILYLLLRDELTPGQARRELIELRDKPPRFPDWLFWVGAIGVAVGICLILQPGRVNVAVSAVAAVLVTALTKVAQRNTLLATLLPTVAALAAGCLVFAAADAGWLEGPLRTLLPPLAAMLPGALLVTGMSDLAAGDMVAGSSRLTYGIVQLLLLSLGVVTAAKLFGITGETLGNVRVDDLGWWAAPAGLVLVSISVCFLESTSLRLLPWILAVLLLAFAAQSLGHQLGGAALGSFLGAITASLGASLCEAIRPRLPRLVIFMPAFWLLVPGSLGLLQVTQLAIDPSQATSTGFDVFTVVCAIALGLLVGSAVASSVRGLRSQVRRRRAMLRPD